MKITQFVPPYRVEIREVGSDTSPWCVADLAETDTQAEEKMRRRQKANVFESRIVPNEPLIVESPDADGLELKRATLRADRLALDNEKLQLELQKLQTRPPTAAQPVTQISAPADAVTGATPLPFNVGDTLVDVHTKIAVRVTEINPMHRTHAGEAPRPGFNWTNDAKAPGEKDATGFCPLGSVGCYVKPGDHLLERASPVIKPPKVEKEKPAARPPTRGHAAVKKTAASRKPTAAKKPAKSRGK